MVQSVKNHPKHVFQEGKKKGDVGEQEVAAFLEALPRVSVQDVSNDQEYQKVDIDFLMTITGRLDGKKRQYGLEVKGDYYYSTGNYFLETHSNVGKRTPGCFLYTEADWLVYYFVEQREMHFISMKEARAWFVANFKQFKARELNNYQNNKFIYATRGRLVPRATLQKACPTMIVYLDEYLERKKVRYPFGSKSIVQQKFA